MPARAWRPPVVARLARTLGLISATLDSPPPMSYRIQVSARIITWPLRCACCGEPPDTEIRIEASKTTGKRVQNTTTKGWDVPYCTRCEAHKSKYEGAYSWLLGGIFLALLAFVVTALRFDGWIGSFIAAGVVIGLSLIPFSSAKKEARGLMKQTCSTPDSAVVYAGWQGSVHSFDFENKVYLQEFTAANAKKIISNIRQAQ